MDESKSGQTQHTQLLCWCCCCLLLQYKLRHHRQNVAIGRRKGWPRRRLDSRKIGNCLQTMSHSHTLSLSISRSLCMSNVSHRHSRVCLSTCGSMCSHVYRFLVIYLFFCSFSSFIEWLSSFSSVLCCCYYHYSIRFTRYGFMLWWSFFLQNASVFMCSSSLLLKHIQSQSCMFVRKTSRRLRRQWRLLENGPKKPRQVKEIFQPQRILCVTDRCGNGCCLSCHSQCRFWFSVAVSLCGWWLCARGQQQEQ